MVGGEAAGGGTRSIAVVLFTDLVGSTELRSRLGEDAAEGLRRKHDDLVAGAVEANRGKLVKHLGDGVMATFGGASDAVAAAVRIHQVLDRHNRSSTARLEVRIGVSAGDVFVEKGDCFGTPVIEAARLCAAARGGQVLVSDVVRLLAGSAGGHQFGDVGDLELKGLPAPLPAFDVAWQPLPVAPLPLPSLLTAMGRIFVGREEQTNALLRLWKEAAAGERRVALLAGEPGVGKTRLAAELAVSVHEEGAMVLAGRCDEDMGVPYQPFVEALRHFVDHAPELCLGRYGGELARLVPELTSLAQLPPLLKSDPETERYRLFDAVAAWLSAVSVDRPLLFILDDLQWAAKPTLLLLRHVVRSADPKRVFILGTYRDTELGHDHPLVEVIADLRRAGSVERMSLTGLDPSGVAAFMQQASGRALDDGDLILAHAVHEETEGNPFFVREVFRHLIETGALERREGRWVTRLPIEQLGIPESVRDVVGRRLSRLSDQANQALRIAAVVGVEFECPVMQAAGNLDEDILLSSLEEATGARLISEAHGRYRFAHALVRDTLYEKLSAPRRLALHRRVAEAIEGVHAARLDDHLPALAHHWARASAPAADTTRAVDYATRAGDRALAQLANDEAVAYYSQALELLDGSGSLVDEAQRCELLISCGEAQRRAGNPGHRQTLFAAAALAEELGDAVGLARAALANSRGFFSVAFEVDAERVAVLEAALEALGSRDSTLRAEALVTLAAELEFSADQERRVRLATEALALARRLGDAQTLGSVLAAGYFSMFASLDVERLEEHAGELVAVGEQLGDPALRFWGAGWRCFTAVLAGDLPAARRHVDAAARLVEDLGQPFMRWGATFFRANLSVVAGDLEEGSALAQSAFELGQSAGMPDASVNLAGQLFCICYEQGRLEEVAFLPRGDQSHLGLAVLRAYLCLTLCELDRPEEARPVFAELAATGFSLPLGFMWLYVMAMLAEVCARLDDAEAGAVLLDRLAPHHGLLATMGAATSGPVAHYLGLLAATLGRHDDAESHFEEAARMEERIGNRVWLARTRLEWARMLLARRAPGDAERGRQMLGQALATARELGLANVERRAAELLS